MLPTKNVLNNKKWNTGIVQVHIDTPPVTLIKSKNYDKSDKDSVKIKLYRDPT